MTLRRAFVVARNRHGRPTLMHRLVDGSTTLTACGQLISGWSRAYTREPIHEILCKTPACWVAPTAGS